jgi:hypothetical protein
MENLDVSGSARNKLKFCSAQQQDILVLIARMTPQGLEPYYGDYYGHGGRTPSGTTGYYAPVDISANLGTAGDRSRQASASRAVTRLEARGLLRRHRRRYVLLTTDGLAVANAIRRKLSLPPLEVQTYEEPPKMTDAEFTNRLEAIEVGAVKRAAEKLSPDGLAELRRWIDARLEEASHLKAVNIATTGSDVNRHTEVNIGTTGINVNR